LSELDEKLNEILGNQEMMGQIMTLARSLSGEMGTTESPEEQRRTSEGEPTSFLNALDPEMVRSGMELLKQCQGKSDRTVVLLQSLRPFLREERQRKLDQALKLAPMLRMFRMVMGTTQMKGDGDDL